MSIPNSEGKVWRLIPPMPRERTVEEIALDHLNINGDHTRPDDDLYMTSVIDLRPTGANYVYVTVAYTDNGDSEKVAVVQVIYPDFDTPQVQPLHCRTLSQIEN